MNILFNSLNVKYENGEYIEVPEITDEELLLELEENGEEFNPFEDNEEVVVKNDDDEDDDDVEDDA
jgi:hypothetical protein